MQVRLLVLARIAVPVLLASLAGLVAAQPATPASPGATRPRLMPLEVTINTVKVGSWALLERAGVLYAPEEALDEWRIERPSRVAPFEFRGSRWYPLSTMPGFHARMNNATQSVELVFSPSVFSATQLADEKGDKLVLSPAEPALFLNFDTSLSLVRTRGSAHSRDLGFLAEAGYASQLGVLTTSLLGRDLLGNDPGLGREVIRLETTLTRDFPQHNLTLRLGDSTTRAGLWGRAVYFGGVQLGRNFGLTPGFVTQPLPLISGASSAPSTVELYVNDALRQTSSVPTGPFTVQNFPVLTGAGEARVVVRDVLGRETVIVQPFFVDAMLLAPGLTDWSVEAGAVRRRLGTESFAYGERFATGTYKYGWSPTTTLETRGEVSSRLRNVGVGVTQTLFSRMLGQAALASSREPGGGSGHEWLLGLRHESLRHGFTLRAQGASRGYVQLGLGPRLLPRQREYSGSYTYSAGALGVFGAGMARIQTYGAEPLDTYSLSYSTRLGQRSSLTLTATRVSGAIENTAVVASLTVPLDHQLTLGGSVYHRGGRMDAYASADKGVAAETGLAWRLLAGQRADSMFSEAGARLYTERSILTADLAASSGQQALRLGAQGGLVLVGGRTFLTQRVYDSFALVHVPSYADVGVGFHGRTVVHTDGEGYALLPRLMPYQVNNIRLDPSDLPISAELDNIELQAVPAARSAVKVVFPVRSGRGALLRIVFDDGQPAPAGAEVALVGDTVEFFVARRGESFVTGLQARNMLRLKWKDASCSFEVNLPPGRLDEIARIGPIACKGVPR